MELQTKEERSLKCIELADALIQKTNSGVSKSERVRLLKQVRELECAAEVLYDDEVENDVN